MKLDHICIRVSNLSDSIDFYQKAFGCEELSVDDFPEYKFTLVFLSFPNSEIKIELTYNYDHKNYDLGDGYGHIGLKVNNIQELHARHLSFGLEITDIKNFNGASDYYFLQDPDGYKIEVVSIPQI